MRIISTKISFEARRNITLRFIPNPIDQGDRELVINTLEAILGTGDEYDHLYSTTTHTVLDDETGEQIHTGILISVIQLKHIPTHSLGE